MICEVLLYLRIYYILFSQPDSCRIDTNKRKKYNFFEKKMIYVNNFLDINKHDERHYIALIFSKK